MAARRDDGRDVRALLQEVSRLSDVVGAAAEDPSRNLAQKDLVAAARRLSLALPELEVRLDEVESLERERDEVLHRLLVLESALESTSESRDEAVRLLGEIREVVTGEPGGGSAQELLAAIRDLKHPGRSKGSTSV